MAFNMHNRHLLSLMHHSTRELVYLLDLSRDLKRARYTGSEQKHLRDKNIALIFEKTSTRTRCAFEVAAYQQGANVTYIDPSSSQIGHKETIKTPPACSGACTTRSNIAAPTSTRSNSWPNMPACRSSTG